MTSSLRGIQGTPQTLVPQTREGGDGLRYPEWLTSLGMLSATLTHELLGPLNALQLMIHDASGRLEGLTCPDVVKQDLADALTACSQIEAIVSRFRRQARYPHKQQDTNVCIRPVAERIFRLLEPSAKQAKVRLWTENLDTLPALPIPENELEQLFFALTQNAVQAADGRKDRHLLITGAVQGDMVGLHFQDNCGGIDPSHLPKIFEPFFTTKSPGQGMGLGLCIARRIVCQRGGQISVESQWQEGTTFAVLLPTTASPTGRGRYVR